MHSKNSLLGAALSTDPSVNLMLATTSLSSILSRALSKEKASWRWVMTVMESLRVFGQALDKESTFAEYLAHSHLAKKVLWDPFEVPVSSVWTGTRQRIMVCQVLWSLHSAKQVSWCPCMLYLLSATYNKVTRDLPFYLFLIFLLSKHEIYIINTTYTSQISHKSHVSQNSLENS